MYKLQKKI